MKSVLAISVFALFGAVALACSDDPEKLTSGESKPTSTEAKDDTEPTPTTKVDTSNPVPTPNNNTQDAGKPPADPANCGASGSITKCIKCCGQQNSPIKECGCGVTSSCTEQCDANLCTNGTPDIACGICLLKSGCGFGDGNGGGGGGGGGGELQACVQQCAEQAQQQNP